MNPATAESETLSLSTSAHRCRIFSLAEIQYATKNFDDELLIGQGGFGKVFKGFISGEEVGHVVAIKRLDSMSDQGELEFRAEIDMLSKLRHCNLVSLIGYCHENKEMILVYEYMTNGTLYHHLHKSDTPLSWLTRLKIAVGAARGLDYLHTGVGTQHGVIHRDVKSSNILLDEKWAAMISDFGLSKISPTNQSISFVDASVKGTFGYLDPEYFYTRKLTRKTDVYAFGVVLFELLSGRLPVDEHYGDDECSLVRWAQNCVKRRKLDQLVDSSIKGTLSPKCLRQFAQISYRCVHPIPKERPTMTEVVASLRALMELQVKFNHSSESSSIIGFNWKVHKYFVSGNKPNSAFLDQTGTSSPKRLENNLNQHEESVTTDRSKTHSAFLDQTETSSPKKLDNNLNKHEESATTDRSKTHSAFLDQTGTSSPKRYDNNLNQHEELVTTDRSKTHSAFLDQSGTTSPKRLENNLNQHKESVTGGLIKMFKYDALKLATRDFRNQICLDESSYNGKVYKGWIDAYIPFSDGTELPIVVKKLHYKPFNLEMLKEFNHPNIVRLIGESSNDGFHFLVYEFMSNGNFEDLLLSGAVARLPLDIKVKILLGIARGTVYLQNPQLNKTWLKVGESKIDRRKILLDEDFTAKFADYDNSLYMLSDPDIDQVDLVLLCNLSGYKVIFMEVLTGARIYNSNRIAKINRFINQCGKESLEHIAQLCFEICIEVDSDLKMLAMLKDHDELIQERLESWLNDPQN